MRQFAVNTPTNSIFKKVIRKAKKQRYSWTGGEPDWDKSIAIIYFEKDKKLTQSNERYWHKKYSRTYPLIIYTNYLKGNMTITKRKKTTHLVIWDETDRDPVREFSSLALAKSFILDSLLDDADCIKDSIRIFEVKSVGKLKMEIVFDK